MDKLLIQLKLDEWFEVNKKLKSFKNELSPEEWTAIEYLSDYWRLHNTIDQDECISMIDVLRDSDKYHSSNREIMTLSRDFRNIAKKMFTEDNETFLTFKKAAIEKLKIHTPTRKIENEKSHAENHPSNNEAPNKNNTTSLNTEEWKDDVEERLNTNVKGHGIWGYVFTGVNYLIGAFVVILTTSIIMNELWIPSAFMILLVTIGAFFAYKPIKDYRSQEGNFLKVSIYSLLANIVVFIVFLFVLAYASTLIPE